MTFQDEEPRPVPPVPPGGEADADEETEEESADKPRFRDDMSDLFEAPQPDDWDMFSDDVIEVDVEKDIVDGPLDDLTDSSTIVGDELGQQPTDLPSGKKRRPQRPPRRQPPPPGGLAGMR